VHPPVRSRRPEFPADLAVGLVGAGLVLPLEAWLLRSGGLETLAVTTVLLLGLGLSIVYKILEQHEASIDIKSIEWTAH